MAIATPRKFAMQGVFELLIRRPGDKSIIAYLTDTKTTGLDNTMEMVYPTGARGNVYIGTGFAHSRRATLTVSLATWNTDVLAIQNGTEVYTGSVGITYYDVIEGNVGAFTTKYTAIGTAGEEIGRIYKVRSDGTYEKEFTQVAGTPSANGEFSYASATKTITFFASDPDAPTGGDMIAAAYTFNTADTAQQITVVSDGLPPTVLVSAYGLARDVCTGDIFPCVIEGQAQVDGNWSFDLAADGDPVVQNFSMEFVKGCLDKTLYTFTVFTEEEA